MKNMFPYVSRSGMGRLFFLAAALCVAACACSPELVEKAFEPGDLKPPSVVSWAAEGARTVVVEFDEDIVPEPAAFGLDGGLGAASAAAEGRRLVVTLDADQEIGARYAISGACADAAGNTTVFVLPFTGFNPRVPGMLVNELLCAGSSTHPDCVEFRTTGAGNLGGLSFSVGKPGDESLVYAFPAAEVGAGDFVVLHLKPSGGAAEVDETGVDTALSGGIDATPTGRDFWCREAGASLPNANGVVVLRASGSGPVLDAAAYTERTSASDSKYGGFGTQAFRDAVDAVAAAGAWSIAGERAAPEDCASSVGVTGTRTLCRTSSSDDTDGKADWHVVPSKGATLGAPNSDAVYSANP